MLIMEALKRARHCAIAMLTLLQPQGAHAQDAFLSTIESIKGAVAPVVCLASGTSKPIQVDGTAFFLNETGTFLSAAHVIQDFLPDHAFANCPQPAVYFQIARRQDGGLDLAWFQFTPNRCVLDPGLDLAKCETSEDLTVAQAGIFKPKPVRLNPATIPDGTPVAFTGYPLSLMVPLTARGNVAGYSRENPMFPTLMIDRNVWPGASGSPIYLADGTVIGIITARGIADAAGLAFARSGQAIDAFLKAHP